MSTRLTLNQLEWIKGKVDPIILSDRFLEGIGSWDFPGDTLDMLDAKSDGSITVVLLNANHLYKHRGIQWDRYIIVHDASRKGCNQWSAFWHKEVRCGFDAKYDEPWNWYTKIVDILKPEDARYPSENTDIVVTVQTTDDLKETYFSMGKIRVSHRPYSIWEGMWPRRYTYENVP